MTGFDDDDREDLIDRLLFSPAAAADPYPIYEHLRVHHPLLHSRRRSLWFASTHALVAEALHDPKLGKAPVDFRGFLTGDSGVDVPDGHALPDVVTRSSMAFSNPPEHTRLRRFAARAFTPRRVAELRPYITATVQRRLDELEAVGEVDLHADYAARLPVDIIGELAGVPDADRAQIAAWVSHSVQVLDPSAPADAVAAGSEAAAELARYFRNHVRRLRTAPGDDVLSALLTDREGEDQLRRPEVVATAVLLFGGGFETTANLVSTGAHLLLDRPDVVEHLRRHPARFADAVEEILRFEGAFHATWYVVLEPTSLGGQALEPGEWVAPMLAAANRDPAEHHDPDRFDVDRRPNHHLAFSAGAHHCLGATLARVETEIALRELFGRFGSITRRPPAPQWSTFPFRRLDRLPVRVAR